MTKKLSLDGKVDPAFELSAGSALRVGFKLDLNAAEVKAPEVRKKAPGPSDKFATGATPSSSLCDDKGSSASSVRQRERSKGGGVPVHELLAQVGKENHGCEDLEDDVAELERRDRELLEEQYQPSPQNDLAGQLLQDAVLDAFHDSMEATAEELGRRNFVREEDLWHERYVKDVNDGVDRDMADMRRSEQINADRRAAERRLDDDRNRR